ncbi:NADH-ubiquinone oxidoreductase 11 kDa subunit [Chlorella sorokiniana]|jgi:hypothetical protein|uniref:NADH-ubiquinone oxidoreductase 11 kDa subunit n=1 Tax=Chlorella sorokiniana TaxID=3076 RepID=A0A2P6TYV2_CHLSO|nr:NADH-ubiquinone oxidoreductase 11 kDa subunit [Chlorella sorokiniana]|eukprot:PRW59244.1 NADH-ubiquinone oxidoreductase 11 kDa subunit [Chlorella sorokiniana]
MALIQYIRDKIQANMEDPTERDRKWEQHLRGVQAAAANAKANMAHPTKNWGFWRHEKHLAKYEQNADPAVAKLPGRRAPNFSSE